MTHLAAPRADDFRALAQSSPWRFSAVHFSHRGPRSEDTDADAVVEAWLDRRTQRVTVRSSHGDPRVHARDLPTTYLVRLDVQSAIAVQIDAMDGWGGTVLLNEIHAVDRPLDAPRS